MSKAPSSGWSSPTLSDTEFDHPLPNPIVVSSDPSPPDTYRRLSRYLPEDKRDAFIGPLEPTISETILLIKRQCPSLAHIPPGDISLKVRFDGNIQEAVKDVLFRIQPMAWPAAILDTLPLVHISTTSKANSNRLAAPEARHGDKSWDDLKAEGALLAERGWTDGPGGWRAGNESGTGMKRREKSKAERYTDTMKVTSQMFEGS